MINAQRFKTFIPIESLDPASLEQLSELAKVEQVNKGSEFIHLGDTDQDFVYVQSGQIDLVSKDGNVKTIKDTDEQSRYPLANLKPRQYKATVSSDTATIIRVDGKVLERMLAWGHVASDDIDSSNDGEIVDEISLDTGSDDREWMLSLLQTKAFLRLPPGNIERMFGAFEAISVNKGDTIIKFGEDGDYFYMIQQGTARVTRPVAASKEVNLATLGPCKGFGEDALISDEPRNATVTMMTDGVLMRLSKQNFTTLLKDPLVKWVNLQEAGQLVRDGAVKIDVRTENEFKHNSIKGSINIPLFLLRLKASQLPSNRKYVLFCDTGVRSEAGAFIMASAGLDVYCLKGGLTSAVQESRK